MQSRVLGYHSETWESHGSLRTGSRPSVTEAREGLDCNHVPLDTVRRRGRVRGVSGRGRARLSPKVGRGLTAITCPWMQFGDVGEAGESLDGVAPVCHLSGGEA